MKCKSCGISNPDDAKFCRNCGKSLAPKTRFKLFLYFFLLLAFGFICWGAWYLLQPTYYIYPEDSEITVSGEGDEYEMIIHTDAPYNKWKAYSHNSWVSVVKNDGEVRIKCKKNLDKCNNEDFCRVGRVFLQCFDREKTTSKIRIIQPESSTKVRGVIEKIWTSKSIYGITIHLNFSVRHMQGKKGFCLIFFYDSNDNMIKSDLDQYTNADGYVFCGDYFFPKYDFSEFHDFEIYIPFIAFGFNKGVEDVSVKANIKVLNDDEWEFVESKEGGVFSISDNEAVVEDSVALAM